MRDITKFKDKVYGSRKDFAKNCLLWRTRYVHDGADRYFEMFKNAVMDFYFAAVERVIKEVRRWEH